MSWKPKAMLALPEVFPQLPCWNESLSSIIPRTLLILQLPCFPGALLSLELAGYLCLLVHLDTGYFRGAMTLFAFLPSPTFSAHTVLCKHRSTKRCSRRITQIDRQEHGSRACSATAGPHLGTSSSLTGLWSSNLPYPPIPPPPILHTSVPANL